MKEEGSFLTSAHEHAHCRAQHSSYRELSPSPHLQNRFLLARQTRCLATHCLARACPGVLEAERGFVAEGAKFRKNALPRACSYARHIFPYDQMVDNIFFLCILQWFDVHVRLVWRAPRSDFSILHGDGYETNGLLHGSSGFLHTTFPLHTPR